MQRDRHVQSNGLQMSGSNGPLHTLRNEMVVHHVETTFPFENVPGYNFRKNFLKKDEIFARVQSR